MLTLLMLQSVENTLYNPSTKRLISWKKKKKSWVLTLTEGTCLKSNISEGMGKLGEGD